MAKINFKQAKNFLDKISKKDKVCMIHHDDLDGFSSGLIFRSFCIKKGAKTKNIPFTLGGDQKKVIKQTKGYNKIILSDLGPSAITEILGSLKDKEVFYTDHHQRGDVKIPNKIKEYRTVDEGYIPSSRTAYELTNELYWLGVCGTLGDAGHRFVENRIFLEHFFAKHKIPFEKFEKEVVYTIGSFLIYFNDKKQKALKKLESLKSHKDVKSLKKYSRFVDREIDKCVKEFKHNHEKIGDIHFYILNSKYAIKSVVTTKISFENPKNMYVIGEIDKNMVRLSARNSGGNSNMIELLKTGTKGLENANCGGHIPAAGGQIQKKDLEKFKENLKDF